MKTTHTYSAIDFARYHRGEMTAEEMHAIEKSALDDPFLSDALDGYAFTNEPGKDLEDLQKRFSAEKSETKVIPIQKKKNAWLRVAAAAIFLGGGAYLFNEMNKKTEITPLAKTEIPVQAKTAPAALPDVQPAAVIPAKPDAVNSTPASATAVNIPQRRQSSLRTEPQQPIAAAPPIAAEDRASGNEVASAEMKDAEKKERKFLKEQVSDRDYKIGIDSGKAGMASVGYNNAAVETISIKSRIFPAKKAAGAVTAVKLSPDSTTDFDQYVMSNNRLPAPGENNSNTKNTYRGTVVLSFKINRKGKPVKIKTENTVCGACDKEAIRLLKEGPAWEYDPKNTRKKVSIPF